MRMVIYDFTPFIADMIRPLTMMTFMCVAHEDLIDWVLRNRYLTDNGYEAHMVDCFCDHHDVAEDDVKHVRVAYYYIRDLLYRLFPVNDERWLCCGFVGPLGYFIHGTQAEELQMTQQRTALLNSISSLRDFYDSITAYPGV